MKYVALLRGIGPSNPNMHHDSFKNFFEGLGFTNITPVISSGNVVFETSETDSKLLESKVEEALPAKLGFKSTTIIRSFDQLKKLAEAKPFKNAKEGKEIVWNVTFLKNKPNVALEFPFSGEGFTLLGLYGDDIPSVIDISATKTPLLYTFLEKKFSKEITTRTWKTVNRILAKME